MKKQCDANYSKKMRPDWSESFGLNLQSGGTPQAEFVNRLWKNVIFELQLSLR